LQESAVDGAYRGRGAGEAVSREAHVFGARDSAVDLLPIAVRHVAAVRPSFAKSSIAAPIKAPVCAASVAAAIARRKAASPPDAR
jgi:hypothetical protein